MTISCERDDLAPIRFDIFPWGGSNRVKIFSGRLKAQILAEHKNLTILLTTHSPVVLNAFRDEPENVYVLEKSTSSECVPVAMSELHSEEWLAQAKLGTLYEHLAFAAPRVESKP